MSLSSEELSAAVAAVPFWWHALDLGHGVVTPGHKSPRLLQQELAKLRLPNLDGRSVLDIGAWDGYFSFQAERLGAQRVVALDHFVWSLDWAKAHERPRACAPSCQAVRGPEHDPEIWRPAELPGKRGFDLAHRVLHSRVEPVVADFMATDLAALGQFDVVLFLGVLYHMRHPLLSLERLAQVTRDVAVIETEAVYVPHQEARAWCEFFEADELAGDPTNWWSPNAKALTGMCRAAGFRRVEILESAPVARRRSLGRRLRELVFQRPPALIRYRLVAHAFK